MRFAGLIRERRVEMIEGGWRIGVALAGALVLSLLFVSAAWGDAISPEDGARPSRRVGRRSGPPPRSSPIAGTCRPSAITAP